MPASLAVVTVARLALGGVVALVAVASLSGCYTEGGAWPGYTSDSYTYSSSSWQPKTVTVRDTRTGQDVWSADVPVGKKLIVQFASGDEKNSYTPDTMKWAIVDEREDSPKLGNALPVPDKTVRRLDVTLRPTPELPEGMTPARPASSAASESR
jgi:hypothetical protein